MHLYNEFFFESFIDKTVIETNVVMHFTLPYPIGIYIKMQGFGTIIMYIGARVERNF